MTNGTDSTGKLVHI